ncbi:hypothetical protein BH10ACT1_BH10ACT1_39280 [soil metagenome]
MLYVLLLLVVAPLAELYVIIQVADVIGGWQTIGLLVIESAIGAWLLKRQGLAALGKISAAIEAGRVPGKELVDGFLILVAGALMLAPGFIGDVIGYLLLIPPTRALFRIPLQKRFESGKHGRLFTMAGGTGPGGRFVGTFRAGTVYDATGQEAAPHDRQQLDP